MTKQSMVVLFVLALAAAWTGAAVAGGSQSGTELLRLEKSAAAMGSTYSVELYGYDRVEMEAAADAALDEARDLDDLLSNYKPESQWLGDGLEVAAGQAAVGGEALGEDQDAPA